MPKYKLKNCLYDASVRLKNAHIASADLDAEVLLAFVLKKPREYLFAHPDYFLNVLQWSKFQILVAQRVKRQPLAYLTGQKEFYGLNFVVNKNVLIPRPETEMLVEEIISLQSAHTHPLNIIDVGTGSGCIAIAIKKLLPAAKVAATEKSSATLRLARYNAKKNMVRINFFQGDLLAKFSKKDFDVIVSNPPYLDIALKKSIFLQSPELKYEPAAALFAKNNGLYYYEQMLKQIIKLKIKTKYIIWEIGHDQARPISALVKKYLSASIEIKKDLCGFDRIAVLKLKNQNFNVKSSSKSEIQK